MGKQIKGTTTHHVRSGKKQVEVDFALKDKDAAPLNFTLPPSPIVKEQQGLTALWQAVQTRAGPQTGSTF